MAGRPEKHNVGYFSHDSDASGRKTLTILFNHFQHEGVSAWWQLLEVLASTNYHYINIAAPEDFEYLSGKLHFPPEKLRAILNKMASLGAIDKELYAGGFIWSQNFVDRLKSVYDDRKQSLPNKPVISSPDNSISGGESGISPADNTQREGGIRGIKGIKGIKGSPPVVPQGTAAKKCTEGKGGIPENRLTTESEFLEYVAETKSEFPDLDCEVEFKKFTLYWSEGKKHLKRPKTAWLNWLTKAREIKVGGSHGGNGQRSQPGNAAAGAFADVEHNA